MGKGKGVGGGYFHCIQLRSFVTINHAQFVSIIYPEIYKTISEILICL